VPLWQAGYLFLQNALFTGGAGFDDYEMIYVSNSPEMAEKLMKDMRTGAQVYGLTQNSGAAPRQRRLRCGQQCGGEPRLQRP